MGKTSYYTIEGEILGERSIGSARLDYILDALGTVTQTVDQTKTSRYAGGQFTPYGKSTNTVANAPQFSWVGAAGYMNSVGAGTIGAEYYVRERFYGCGSGLWNTRDPLWPRESGYGYVQGNPISWADPSGLQVLKRVLKVPGGTVDEACLSLALSEVNKYGPYPPERGNKQSLAKHNAVDKLQHCVFYCIVSRCGFVTATALRRFPWLSEGFGPKEKEDDLNDMKANEEGIRCAADIAGGAVLDFLECWTPIGVALREAQNFNLSGKCRGCCANKGLDQRLDHNPPYLKRWLDSGEVPILVPLKGTYGRRK